MRPYLALFLLIGCIRYAPFTPLADAARAGDIAAIRDLTAHGADPNEAVGQNNWTPLEHAIHKAQLKSVEVLLDAGADPNRADAGGTTPLMMAAGYGYTDIVQLLLRRGAKPSAKALDMALTGVSDIDRFTLFQCQDQTVNALRAADPSMSVSPRALMWARAKRCSV